MGGVLVIACGSTTMVFEATKEPLDQISRTIYSWREREDVLPVDFGWSIGPDFPPYCCLPDRIGIVGSTRKHRAVCLDTFNETLGLTAIGNLSASQAKIEQAAFCITIV